MAKVFLQDVVPTNKRSIRNIPLPGGRSDSSSSSSATKEAISGSRAKKAPPKKPTSTQGSKTSHHFFSPRIFIAAIILLLVVVYAGSFLVVRATVKIIPKEINTQFTINSEATLDATDPTNKTLGYTLVTLSRENSREITATGEEKVERKASGKIIIYNEFSTAPQALVANTRFQTSSGLIFRIQKAVTVPGQKTVNGTVIPGSLAVTIYADKAGEQYNVGLSDFTIPGFIGDPKYKKITAKSDPSSPVSGGFIGTVKKVSPAEVAAAKVSIETELKGLLKDDINSQIPDSHVLFSGAYIYDFEELPQTAAGTKAVISEKGTVYGILFDRVLLSKFLATQTTDVGADKDVLVSNLDSLTFVLDNKEAFSPTATKDISFKLTGNASFVWNIDATELAESLAGKKRANIKDILANYESVDRASVVINPIWIMSLPNKPEKIKIEVEEKE